MQDAANAFRIDTVAIRPKQHLTQICILLSKAVQLRQIGESLDRCISIGVLPTDCDQPLRHLILQMLQQIADIPVVNIKCTTIDVRPL